MNVTPLPKVRDLTDSSRRLPIETDGSAVFDMLMTLFVAFDREEETKSFELGSEWFAEVTGSVSDELRAELELVGGPESSGWLALIGMVASAPYPHDIDSVLAWLSRLEPAEFRYGQLSYCCPREEIDSELLDRAARGDTQALEHLVASRPDTADHLRQLFAMEQGAFRDRMVEALRRFRADVYARFETEFGAATSRAAAARRAIVKGTDPETVIEEVTNGLDYRIPPGIRRMVLVPSVVLRPWAVIDQHRDTLVVAYPVADEFIDADPDAPPSWVVKLHKALADERRLRILRRLSEGPASLDDLVEMLGLTKSTVHHHVGLLRGAGLVRVAMDKTYTLRRSVLPEAQATLDDYLRTGSESREDARNER